MPVLIGSAEGDNGVRRLLKALRHEVPEVAAAAERAGIKPRRRRGGADLKTFHGGHGGKLSLVRVLSGSLKDGAGAARPRRRHADGRHPRAARRQAGQEKRSAGGRHGGAGAAGQCARPATACPSAKARRPSAQRRDADAPVYRLAIAAADRKDEVKVTAAIAKLIEEDPSLAFEQNADTQDMILAGQGEIHLKVAIEKLQSKYGLKLATRPPRVPYRETIRKSATARGRHKRQIGRPWPVRRCGAGDRARCRAARASSSTTASRAAWCPSNGSARSRKACGNI